MGFIGFGSAIIRTKNDPVKQAEEEILASKLAEMRAKSAFLGMIQGERIQNTVRIKEESFDASVNYDDLVKVPSHAAGEQKIRKAIRDFDSKMQINEEYRSAHSGHIPPGIVTEK